MEFRLRAAVAIALLLAMSGLCAQGFPSKQIRIVEGFPTGPADTTIRLVAADMSRQLGQPVVVEVIPGASGAIAASTVARAAPDGYTLLFLNTVIVSSIFVKDNPVDPNGFAPVSDISISPVLFIMNPKLPIKSFQDLVAYSKKNPGKLNFGGVGNNTLLMVEVLKERTGANWVNVPYQNPAAVMTAILGGTLDIGITPIGGAAPLIRSGGVRALFVSTTQRVDALPDVPTITELGVRDFIQGIPVGLWAPQGTPREVTQRLNQAAVAAVKNPEIAQKMRSEAILVVPDGSTPDEQLQLQASEVRFYTEAARLMKFVPQ
jgi:tripartite-type tricarboxylate transporter receptor subunit TctC